MTAFAGNLTSVGNPFQFSLFFARQPEPDLEFTEEELEQTTATRPITPMKMPKKSGGGRPLLWLLILALIGGAGYVAMEPEQVTEWLAPFLGEPSPTQPASPVAAQPSPAPPAPVPSTAPTQSPVETAAAPAAPAVSVPPPAAPAPPIAPPVAATPAPVAPKPSAPSPMSPPPGAGPARSGSSPLFAEGQKVTAIGNPTAPAEMVALTLDAAGSKPGPAIRPGTSMSILDGDLQANGWVYSVRTDDGVKGWIPENRLRLKF
jgi:hypothetical protein